MSQSQAAISTEQSSSPAHSDRDVVLLCNPMAGGRWRELARILDSEDARAVRRIVTDSIDDIAPALESLSRRTQLVCIYGGDGTIQRILDRLFEAIEKPPILAFIGGGTMNVTATWCGLSQRPRFNFRRVYRGFRDGSLLLREVPLLEVRHGGARHFGFTFGVGPIIRALADYEQGQKGKLAGLGTLAKAVGGGFGMTTGEARTMMQPMTAEILLDGERLSFSRYSAVFCNSTGQLHLGVKPFNGQRQRDRFFAAAYAASQREVALLFPLLARGWTPMDPKALLKPVATWKQVALSYIGKSSFPADPRYLNTTASTFEVHCHEQVYTVDGEVYPSSEGPFEVRVGPMVQLAVSPSASDLS
jgi:diacylglycerol kinase family enzyme